MTVCVGVAVHDCLVFAADSASTLIGPNPAAPGQSAVLNVYRHGNKVFNLYKKLPIAAMTCGMGNHRNGVDWHDRKRSASEPYERWGAMEN